MERPVVHQRLVTGLADLGQSLESGQIDRLIAHLELLERWNRTHNLVGPGSPEEWPARHTLDSLAAARFLPGGQGFDVGSGAGFPGIPLAIARPDCRITLVEPRGKRAAFLANAIATLGLPNVALERRRLEPAETAEAGFAISRATLPLPAWLELAASLLAKGGLAVAFLGIGGSSLEPIAKMGQQWGLNDARLESYRIDDQPERALALLRK